MNKAQIGLFGASGYSGIEATKLLAFHPHVELAFVASDRWEGQTVGSMLGIPGAVGKLPYLSSGDAENAAKSCQVVLLATPAEGSLALVPKLLTQNTRIIDFSGAFRLKDASKYPRFYGFDHPAPRLLEQAVYGLPELFRPQIAEARLLANPGCYATAATLAVAPFLGGKLLESDSLIVDAASGVSGAGRRAGEDYSFCEIADDFRAYKVFKHQHSPEIVQVLERVSGSPIRLTFTPHLLPIKRGILATAYARVKKGVSRDDLTKALSDFCVSRPFLRIASTPDLVSLKAVVGTNHCLIGVTCEEDGMDPQRVVVTCSIDNLVKGAAGQAIQNLNLMMGWDETTGLELRGFYP